MLEAVEAVEAVAEAWAMEEAAEAAVEAEAEAAVEAEAKDGASAAAAAEGLAAFDVSLDGATLVFQPATAGAGGAVAVPLRHITGARVDGDTRLVRVRVRVRARARVRARVRASARVRVRVRSGSWLGLGLGGACWG